MAYFEWADDMVIDGGALDDDHKQLIALVNDLHTATSQGLGQDIVGHVMDQLVTYTEQHFAREERLMAAARFAKLGEHQRLHQTLVEQLHALQARYRGGSITTAAQLSTLLRDWLSLHIRRSDRELRDVLPPRRP